MSVQLMSVRPRVSPLPYPVRFWGAACRPTRFRGQARVGTALVRRFVSGDVHYLSSDSLALRVDPDDYFQACMMLGLYDPILRALVRQFAVSGSSVMDVGACLGYISLLSAVAVGPTGRVYSFEPDPRLTERFRENVSANAMDWVVVDGRAISGSLCADIELALPEQLGWATTRLDFEERRARTVIVPSTTIDSYVQTHDLDPKEFSLIKIDVEGAECEVLEGLRETLGAGSPAVVIEFIPERIRQLGQDPAEILGVLRRLGYEPWAPRLRRRGMLRLDRRWEYLDIDDLVFLKPG